MVCLAGGKAMGYDVISPASDAPYYRRVMMLDTGLVFDGYFVTAIKYVVVPSPGCLGLDKLRVTSAGTAARLNTA